MEYKEVIINGQKFREIVSNDKFNGRIKCTCSQILRLQSLEKHLVTKSHAERLAHPYPNGKMRFLTSKMN